VNTDHVYQDTYTDTSASQTYSLLIVGRLYGADLRLRLSRDSYDFQGDFVCEHFPHGAMQPQQWTEVARIPAGSLSELPSPYGGRDKREDREHALRMVAVRLATMALLTLHKVSPQPDTDERIFDFCLGGVS